MKILVLGGHGFVGKSVMELLKKTSHEAIPLSRRDGLDIRDYTATVKTFETIKPDVIVNCAAHVGSLHYVTTFAADVMDDNVQMTLNLYRAVKNVCPRSKIINPIANCSYPGNVAIQVESEWWSGPVHPSVISFGNARRFLGAISECYAIQFGLRSVNFLVPGVYGPGDYTDATKTHALTGLILRMLKAHNESAPEFEIWGTGRPSREWIYVEDLARMFIRAIDSIENQIHPVNIAQNKGYSIREAAEIVKQNIGYHGTLVYNTKYPDGAMSKVLDNKLFLSKFPDFVFTPMDKGIRETIRYYKKVLGI